MCVCVCVSVDVQLREQARARARARVDGECAVQLNEQAHKDRGKVNGKDHKAAESRYTATYEQMLSVR